jgi:transcription elongation GreA/GreB family factor
MSKALKRQLLEACQSQLAERIASLEAALAAIQESKNNETKSSAGDKYETGRAMMQLEADKISARLDLAKSTQQQLRQIKVDTVKATIGIGSIVKTDQRTYFVSVSLGKVQLHGDFYYCISTEAPLARLMMGKRAGEVVEINGRKEKIREVE